MIDMETLDTQTSTVILSIGAVTFDPLSNKIIDSIEIKPSIEEQTEVYNRTISEDTLAWWAKQSIEAQDAAFSDEGRVSYKEAMQQLAKFSFGHQSVWSNGSIFDIMIAESGFRELKISIPWQFWNIRDCRTIYDIAGVSLKDKKYASKTTHNALEDAIHQANVVQDAYQKLRKLGLTHLK